MGISTEVRNKLNKNAIQYYMAEKIIIKKN